MIIDSHHKNSLMIRDNVEIVISSNDHYEYKKIIEFSEINLNFYKPRIITPYKNINGDNNIASSSSLCNGKYVWILCDDDICSLFSIEYILDCIKKYNFSLLYLEPLTIKPSNVSINNIDFSHLNYYENFSNELNSFEKSFDVIDIDDVWLENNIFSLLRASSLVYSREKTHKYWTSFFYKNGNGIASFCIALDALSGGFSIRSKLPKYIYMDANKESWSKSWLYIYYFELLPVAKYFLIENKLKIKKVNFRIAKNDLIPLIISILYNWKKFLVIKNMKQVIKYIF
jgi:hypothetical protein